MIGAGLIKMRGDRCWWPDLTCMDYHYETQPVPNPLSWYFHHSPPWWHKVETLGNHVVELALPWLLLSPWRAPRLAGGLLQIAFQLILIASGNLSFLNWLTILPAIACLDDHFLSSLVTRGATGRARAAEEMHADAVRGRGARRWLQLARGVGHLALAGAIAYLSVPVVQNLLSQQQAMNTSFDSLRLVNTYGAFGSITKERHEVVLQGTVDDPSDPRARWLEYQFKCKPGDVARRPCLISPYHYRLDWLMWFAAFGHYQHHPWLVHLCVKLLQGEGEVLGLMAHNPFSDRPPSAVRAEHFLYQYTAAAAAGGAAASGDTWRRTRVGEYLPALTLGNPSLRQFVEAHGWPSPDP